MKRFIEKEQFSKKPVSTVGTRGLAVFLAILIASSLAVPGFAVAFSEKGQSGEGAENNIVVVGPDSSAEGGSQLPADPDSSPDDGSEPSVTVSIASDYNSQADALPELPVAAVLSAEIDGKLPEGSAVTYQWQVADLPAETEPAEEEAIPDASISEPEAPALSSGSVAGGDIVVSPGYSDADGGDNIQNGDTVDVTVWDNIQNATESTYTLRSEDEGKQIRVRIFATYPPENLEPDKVVIAPGVTGVIPDTGEVVDTADKVETVGRARMAGRAGRAANESIEAFSSPVLVMAARANLAIYVSNSGDDKSAGTATAPVRTLNQAYTLVDDGGIIHILNNPVSLPAQVTFNAAKNVTLLGTELVTDGTTEATRSIIRAGNYVGSMLSVTGGSIRLKHIILNGAGQPKSTGALLSLNNAGAVLDTGAVVTGGTRGGVSMTGSSTLTMNSNSKISSNSNIGGGGVSMVGNNTLTMNDSSEISGNTATDTGGGGVSMANGGTLTMDGDSKISDNRAAGGSGGGIDVTNSAVDMKGKSAVLVNSVTFGSGGGINVGDGTLSIDTGASITGNKTESANGGGVFFFASNRVLTLKGSISKNTANSSAGGLYVDGTVNIDGGKIDDNVAKLSSGGIFVSKGTTTLSNGGSISGNTATTGSGGGVAVTAGKFVLLDGSVSGNKCNASGGAIIASTTASGGVGTVDIQGGSISNNVAGGNGGAIYSTGKVTVSGGAAISDNSVTAATGRGGGIYHAGSRLELSGGTIAQNRAVNGGSGIYASSLIEVVGAPVIKGNTTDNIYLVSGRSLAATGALTGGEGDISVYLSSLPGPSQKRAVVTGGKAGDQAPKIVKIENIEPEHTLRLERGDLWLVNYTSEARLFSLTRDGFRAAGEVAVVEMGTADGFYGSGSADNTAAETVQMEIPYAVTASPITVTATASDPNAEIRGTVVGVAPTVFAAGKPLVIPVTDAPERVAAGDTIATVTIKVTSQLGVGQAPDDPSKTYTVNITRGFPKITGNDTVNVNFDTGDTDDTVKTHDIVIDKLRQSTIGVGRFEIRMPSPIKTVQGAEVKGVSATGFNPDTGMLEISVTKEYAKGHMSKINEFASAGKQVLSLWITSTDGKQPHNMGDFIVNMTMADGKLFVAFNQIATLNWKKEVYPTAAYIRAGDKPAGDSKAWPLGTADLLVEDVYGNWGKLNSNGEFEWLNRKKMISYVKSRLEADAAAKVNAKIKEIGDNVGATLPRYELIFAESEYIPAVNSSAISAKGQDGLYTFRIDIALVDDEGTITSRVAGQSNTVPVKPGGFDGISEDELYSAMQNDAHDGLLDGIFKGEIWVENSATEKETFEQIYQTFLMNPTGTIHRRVQNLANTYPNLKLEVSHSGPDSDLVSSDGIYYTIDAVIRAHKADAPTYEWEDADTGKINTSVMPKYITVAHIPVVFDLKINHNKNRSQLLAEKATEDIVAAIENSTLEIPDAVSVRSAAAAAEYVRARVAAQINTPKDTELAFGATTITLDKPLRELVTVTVKPRSKPVETAGRSYIAAVDGTRSNPAGTQGQYAFEITVSAAIGESKFEVPVRLNFSGDPVRSATGTDGSVMDDGIILLPVKYSYDDGNDSEVTTPPTVPKVPENSTNAATRPGAGTVVIAQKPTESPSEAATAVQDATPEATPNGSAGDKLSEAKNVHVKILQPNSTAARLSNIDAVISAALTPAEIEAVKNGEQLEIVLKVVDLDNATSQGDKAIMKRKANEKKWELGAFLDISMEKRIGNSEWITVSELNSSVEIEIVIPPDLVRSGREYSMVHSHNGDINFYSNLSDQANLIRFEAAQFSTFAIIYRDGTPSNGIINIIIALAIAGVTTFMFVLILAKRRMK